MQSQSSAKPAVVLDATIAVAIASKESTTQANANAEVNRYLTQGYDFYAPGVLVSETLFALCRMRDSDNSLTAIEHAQAVADFNTMLSFVLPSPQGDFSLVLRADAIRGSYTCYRSTDALYIALAEHLSATRPTILLTLDDGIKNQAISNAPNVTVHVVTP